MTGPVVADAPPPSEGLSATQLAALLVLVRAQARIREQITTAAVDAVLALVRAMPAAAWWDDTKVTALVAKVLRVVVPAQRKAARVADAYTARSVKVMTGRPARPAGIADLSGLRRKMSRPELLAAGALRPAPYPRVDSGIRPSSVDAATRFADAVLLGDTRDGPSPHVDTRIPDGSGSDRLPVGEQYQRVAREYRRSVVAQGMTEDAATRNAAVRIATVVDTDIALAVREQVRTSMTALKVDKYRRVLHPELSKSGPCGLCVVAANRVYWVKDLLPIHGRCCCETLPIIGALDPGITLNQSDLERIYAAAHPEQGRSTTAAKALKRVRVALVSHSELGPQLVDADQRRRSPVEVARASSPDPTTRLRAQLEALDVSYAALVRRQLAGEDVERPLTWQRNRIAALQRDLAAA